MATGKPKKNRRPPNRSKCYGKWVIKRKEDKRPVFINCHRVFVPVGGNDQASVFESEADAVKAIHKVLSKDPVYVWKVGSSMLNEIDEDEDFY